jgi:chromosome segregation ATPase
MTKIYNIRIMTDEKNPFINPQAEGSNAIFSRKGKEVIKGNSSEQLLLMKNQLESYQINRKSHKEIESKIAKKIIKVGTQLNISFDCGIFGVFKGRSEAQRRFEILYTELTKAAEKTINVANSELFEEKNKLVNNLAKLSEQVNDRENGLLAEIDKLTLEIAKMENRLDQYKEAEKRLKERQEARIKKGQTLESKAIVDLKTAKERISELEAEITDLEEQLEEMTILRDGAEIRVNEWKGKTELKQTELDNAIKSLEILNQRVEEARAERDKAQTELNTLKNVKLKNKKDKISNLKDKVNKLEKELKKHEPSMLYQVAEKLGIIQLKNSISNVLIIAGAVVVLYAISWMWKYLVKPTYRNFKGEDENELQPRRKEKGESKIYRLRGDSRNQRKTPIFTGETANYHN